MKINSKEDLKELLFDSAGKKLKELEENIIDVFLIDIDHQKVVHYNPQLKKSFNDPETNDKNVNPNTKISKGIQVEEKDKKDRFD